MSNLIEALSRVGYRITPELAHQVEAALHTRPAAGCFLSGPAGSGKTFLSEATAKVQDRSTFFFQAFPGCRKEELFQTILPDADQPSGFRTLQGVLPQAAASSQAGPTALVLDEWDKTHPSTDAFLLDFLQNGRVTVPGSEISANQDNLVVFVTLNDERELSEPLLRRLPMIEMRPPPPPLVQQALRDTHGDHPYIPPAVTLYRRSLLVPLIKPVTIQELRQLLDAIELLGPHADWNRLVFQFITKSWDDHEQLKTAEHMALSGDAGGAALERPVLDVTHFGPSDSEHLSGGETPHMPRIQRDWMERLPNREIETSSEQVYGLVPRTESGYDGVARAMLNRPGGDTVGNDPSDFRIAQVGSSEIVVFEALNFEKLEEWGQILKDGGELLLEVRHEGEIGQRMLLEFKAATEARFPEDENRCRVYSLTEQEMLLRYRNLKMRWTPELFEVVAVNFDEAYDLWDFLYGRQGAVPASRLAATRMESPEHSESGLPPNEQLREDYLFVLRDFRHLRQWFALLINRNLKVWGRVTCEFRNLTVIGSALGAPEFKPDQESPENKEEAESISIFRTFTQPAVDYYDSHLAHIESEMTAFVAQGGELPPAVEDGGIFGLHEVHTDVAKIKREGLKLYMRKTVREA